jgi:Xaa-Pro aminopeptidase
MQENDIDCFICMAPESQFYLTGYDTFLGATLPQAVIFTAHADEPTFLLWDADIAIAYESTWVSDLRTYRFGVDQPVDRMAGIVHEKAPHATRVAIDASTSAVSYGLGKELEAALSGVTLVDGTLLLANLRVVKSPTEIALMRKAGGYARLGLAAAKQHARPGLTEIALAAEIEYAMRKGGSDYWSIPTEMATGTRSICGHGTPRHRPLEAGDFIHLEIGGVENRYNAVGIQTFVVPGKPPSSAGVDLYNVALKTLRAGLATIRPGVVAAEVEEPALTILRAAGLGDNFKMRFGYGVGIGYPPSWLEPLKITRTSDQRLEVGMTFVLHSCLLDDANSLGVLVGGTYVVTDDGYELLSGSGAVELEVAGSAS